LNYTRVQVAHSSLTER